MAVSGTQARFLIQDASVHHGVPESILWGVYGIETDFGQNIATSSAGAMGAFQFIPSTAARYHYPMTNNVDGPTFQKQVNAAASYLHDLYKQTGGDWDKALKIYSGGGYGLDEVKKSAAQANQHGAGHFNLTDLGGAIVNVAKAPADLAHAITDPVKAIANFFFLLTQASTWLRIGKVLLGVLLFAIVFYMLLKG